MSEKWRSTQFGTDVYCESQSSPIARTCEHELAQQIVREHNAVPALVEALRRILSLGITHHTEKEARAALALAEEK